MIVRHVVSGLFAAAFLLFVVLGSATIARADMSCDLDPEQCATSFWCIGCPAVSCPATPPCSLGCGPVSASCWADCGCRLDAAGLACECRR